MIILMITLSLLCVQEPNVKLRAELKQLPSNTHDSLMAHAPFCDGCINEALRLIPPVAADGRYCLNGDVLPSGLVVRPGTLVGVANMALGRNPALFEDPESFVPERWAAGDKIHQTHEYDVPVACVGQAVS